MSLEPTGVGRRPRILFAFSHYRDAVDPLEVIEALCSRLRSSGMSIDCMSITLDAPGPPLTWPELDARWQRGDPALMTLYEQLAVRLEGYDALVNGSGINLHPEFVRQLDVVTIFACFDDPESSALFSRPVASSYDLCMVGNLAEVATYRSWGVREAHWWPLGFRATDFDPGLTAEHILEGRRDIDITLLCERVTGMRGARLDRFHAAFPNGIYRGRAWPGGWLPEAERVPLYQRTRIGPNFHNSTGPVNSRTFVLPANGVMQVCDNRSHLAQAFTLGSEIIGVDDVEEAIEACRYYLAHEDERRRIAAAGWARATRDYSETAVFARLETAVIAALARRTSRPHAAPSDLVSALRSRRCRKPLEVAAAACLNGWKSCRRFIGSLLRKAGWRK